jgi:Matrixin
MNRQTSIPQRSKTLTLVATSLFAAAGLLATSSQAQGARRVSVKSKIAVKVSKTVGKTPGTAAAKSALTPSSTVAAATTTTASVVAPTITPTVSLLPQAAPSTSALSAAAPTANAPSTTASVTTASTTTAKVTATNPPGLSATTVTTSTVASALGAASAIPTPVIAGIDITDKSATLRLDPAAPNLYAHVRFSGAGFERFATEILGTAGQTTFSLGRAPDPNTQYTLRISWDSGPAPTTEELSAPKPPIGAKALLTTRSPTAGPEIVRVLAPRFPQPVNRSPGLVAGQGWTSLLTSTLETTRRNPCVAWKIVYDDRNAPLDFQARLKSSIAQVAEATGVPIEYGGIERIDAVTDPQKLRVAWDTSPTATLGLARQSYVRDGGGTVWRTSGTITMAATRRGITADRWHAVVLHELGHIFGLDHTNQPTSVMYSPVESGENWPYSALFFTETDRAGLLAMNGKETGGSCSTVLEDPLNP